MRLFEQWCEAGFEPDSFWRQPPRLVRLASEAYQERLYKAAELAGHRVTRGDASQPVQGGGQSPERMKAHFATLAQKGLVTVRNAAPPQA